MSNLDTRNLNSLWASVFVETLVREGLQHAVISPGSRSTPLTLALAAAVAVDTTPVVDERSAAFFALGIARRTHRPVVLLCTSGSAGAHYLPALIEAHETGVPLIVITADRPPELRDCASGQTIDQHRLFGKYANWYHEMAVPELDGKLFAYLRQTTRQAWTRANTNGPVHLNTPFRDPLPPVADEGAAKKFSEQLDEGFFAIPDLPEIQTGAVRFVQRITTQRGLIIAGPAMPADPAAYVAHILSLSATTGWPILADALSPLRQGAAVSSNVIAGYDIILRNEALARDLNPRYVVALESWPTSKALRNWLESSQAEMVMVSEREGSRDAVHGRTREITASPMALQIDGHTSNLGSFANSWLEADAQVTKNMNGWMQTSVAVGFEGSLTYALAGVIPDNADLVVASSMPVRDVECFWPKTDRGLRIYSSRGANGIDGTLSTALGVAHESERPVFLLTGDLAFLHDSNGLLVAREFKGSLTVLLINNSGGGIFEHLPVAKFEPPFERYFGTPPTVDFGDLCHAHGVDHIILADLTGLAEKISAPSMVLRVFEYKTDRKKDAATRKKLLRSLARAS
tara:strand:- start:882 stop:2603 length:1722 start_codon:yes stop_codon:yes gene_type:complete